MTLDLRRQPGPADKGIARELDALDLDHRPFGDVKDHARIARLVSFEKLDAGEQAALLVIAPLDGVASLLIGNGVERPAFAHAGDRLQFLRLQVLGALINNFLDDAGQLDK